MPHASADTSYSLFAFFTIAVAVILPFTIYVVCSYFFESIRNVRLGFILLASLSPILVMFASLRMLAEPAYGKIKFPSWTPIAIALTGGIIIGLIRRVRRWKSRLRRGKKR